MSQRRSRRPPELSFTERLLKAAAEARERANKLKDGKRKNELLEKAREFETQLDLNSVFETPGANIS